MTPRIVLLLLAVSVCATRAGAQDAGGDYVDPSSDWRMDPIERKPPADPAPKRTAPTAADSAAEPAGPRAVAKLPPDTPPPASIPQIAGPEDVAPPLPEIERPKRLKLRIDSSFGAFEAGALQSEATRPAPTAPGAGAPATESAAER